MPPIASPAAAPIGARFLLLSILCLLVLSACDEQSASQNADAASGAGPAQQGVTLQSKSGAEALKTRLNLTEGQVFRLRQSLTKITSFQVSGTKRVQNSEETLTYRFNVLKQLEDGSYRLQTTIERTKLREEAQGRQVRFDSKHDANQPLAELPKSARTHAVLAGQTFRFRLFPDGRLANVEGTEAFIGKLMDAMPAGGSMLTPAEYRRLLKEAYGPEGMRRRLSELFTRFPSGEGAAPGDVWSYRHPLPGSMKLQSETQLRFTERQPNAWHLNLNGTVRSPADSVARFGAFRVTPDLRGKRQGGYEIDPATGLVRNANFFTQSKGKLTGESDKLPFGSMSIDYSNKRITRLRRLPADGDEPAS